MKQINISVYTDGACSGNPGPGGYAAVGYFNGKEIFRIGEGFRHTTNNRMETLAVAEALEHFNKLLDQKERRDTNITVTVYSDSQLIVKTLKENWSRKSNLDLWAKLDTAVEALERKKITVCAEKVPGHSTDRLNNLVDQIAVMYSKTHATKVDEVYENISKYEEPTLFRETAHTCKPEIKEIRFLNHDRPNERKLNIMLSNGTTVSVIRCEEGFEQYGCTKAEAAVTVDIAWRFLGWLKGKNL